MSKKHPMALRRGDRNNFKTLLAAASNGDLALLSAKRKSDGAKVALVCAMNRKDGYYYPAPVAVMIEGNPYEIFEDPCSDVNDSHEALKKETKDGTD